MTDESKALTEFAKGARNNAEDTLTNIETGDLSDIRGIEIAGSHGAVTSLFAGTAPEAGEHNGSVC